MTRTCLALVAIFWVVGPAHCETGRIIHHISRNATNILSHQTSNKPATKKALASARQDENALVSKGAMLHDFVSSEGISVEPGIVNDSVMGGESTSSVSFNSEGALFQGTVTRENGGGFASVKFTADDQDVLVQRLRSGSGIRFAVRHIEGCAAWKMQLNGADGNFISALFGRGWVQWQADFTATSNGNEQQIAFADLIPTRYGEPLGDPGLSGSAFDSITGFGFMMSFLAADGSNSTAFSTGPFALNIMHVEVY